MLGGWLAWSAVLTACTPTADRETPPPSTPWTPWTPEPTRVAEKLGWTKPIGLERSPYFPLCEQRIHGLTPFVIDDWFTAHWRAMQLPPLYARAGETGVEIYRFVELPTWGRPISVTLEIDPTRMSDAPWLPKPGVGGAEANVARSAYAQWASAPVGEIRYVVLDGSGGYAPGGIAATGRAVVHRADAADFRESFAAADLDYERTGDPNLGLDGTTTVLEFLRDGRYHIVDRWLSVRHDEPRPDTQGFVAVARWLRDAAVPRPLR
ncbi:MAG: hypothetical protein AAGE65_06560 [Planctomycetota bacterium]